MQHLNGGYIVIGVAEDKGRAILPPKGLSEQEIDAIQKWLRGHCQRIDPVYQPVFSPEMVDGKRVLVIWCPGSDNRPHATPDAEKDRKYYVRLGAETVDAAKSGLMTELLQLTARIPFDDRRLDATIEDLRESRVREFLHDIGSGLLAENQAKELYRKMRIAVPVNGHDAPRNIGLMLFSESPERWFPGAQIDVVQFPDGASGNILEEEVFRGGIHEQLRRVFACLENISSVRLEKQPHSYRVKGLVNYPVAALREALVNAVYHKSYEISEPVKVYLYPDRIEITSSR